MVSENQKVQPSYIIFEQDSQLNACTYHGINITVRNATSFITYCSSRCQKKQGHLPQTKTPTPAGIHNQLRINHIQKLSSLTVNSFLGGLVGQ